MKGLLVKDFALLSSRKRSFIIIAACGVFMGISTDMSFVSGWLLMIMGIFALSTVSYDEYDNCYPFLMSLPVTRRIYAAEKYVFGLIMMLASIVLTTLIAVVAKATGNLDGTVGDYFLNSLLMMPAVFLILDINIPISLKFGSEKSRSIMLIVYGIVFAGYFVLVKMAGITITVDTAKLSGSFSGSTALIVFLAFSAAVTALSVKLSINAMEKKEF